jgi:hypothetical protein
VLDVPGRRICWIVLLLALIQGPPALSMPNVRLIEEDLVLLTVRPLNARLAPDSAPLANQLELEDRGVELPYRFVWPEAGQVTEVLLRASPRPPRPGAKHVVLLESRVKLPDGKTVRAKREMVFNESYTSLFEVYRDGGRTLVLAIQAEHYRDTRLSVAAEVGEPIQFQLEIQRVDGEQSYSLETNRLNTFVGDPVSYSFQIGAHGEGESMRIRLTPQKLYGDVAQVEVDISGMLPDGDKISIISRTEQLLTTRGATSSLSVAAGQPPIGFKFLVTPWF